MVLSHRKWNDTGNRPVEDYIDFECSDTFRAYYYERGLTPHPPAGVGIDNRLKALESQISSLIEVLGNVVALIAETPVRGSQGDYGPHLASPQVSASPKPIKRPIWTDMP